MKLRFYILLLVLLINLLIGFTLRFGYEYQFSLAFYVFRILGISIVIMLMVKMLMSVKDSERSDRTKNLILTIITLGVVFSTLEIAFMFVPRTHGGDKTLASRVWYHYYWENNSWWYRDSEPDSIAASTRTKIAIMGDSFVAGHGIKRVEQRFSNILAQKMGDDFYVYNLARNGSSTEDEFKGLEEYPIKPDLLILCHLPNDIAFIPTVEPEGAEILSAYIVGGSYLLNYFVFKFEEAGRKIAHRLYGREEEQEFVEYLKSGEAVTYHLALFLDSVSLAEHEARLGQIADYCNEKNIKLGVVLFPEIWNETLNFSEEHVNLPLAKFFKARNVPSLDTYNLFKSLPEEERVVNFNDAHPSVASHKLIADSLFLKLHSWGFLEKE